LSKQSTTTDRPTNTRERILFTALDLFNRNGIVETSIQTIQQEASTSIGSIYHHFGNKEGIVAQLYVGGIQQLHDVLLPTLDTNHAQDGVTGFVYEYLSWFEDNSAWGLFLFQAVGMVLRQHQVYPDQARNQEKIFMLNVKKWLDSQIQQGNIKDFAPRFYTSLVIGPSREFLRTWLVHQDDNIQTAKHVFPQAAWQSVKTSDGK
jgi:AcrR family transcriptional regulator